MAHRWIRAKRKKPSADYEDEAGRWLAFARGDLDSAAALNACLLERAHVDGFRLWKEIGGWAVMRRAG